jgi:hypothetical protein
MSNTVRYHNAATHPQTHLGDQSAVVGVRQVGGKYHLAPEEEKTPDFNPSGVECYGINLSASASYDDVPLLKSRSPKP